MSKIHVFHKSIRWLVTIVIMVILSSMTVTAAGDRTKDINVVYDDSGSMCLGDNTSWSQAKYAIEVFSALLGPNDSMTIYPMSSFSYVDPDGKTQSPTWEQVINLNGKEPVNTRINTVDAMNGSNGIFYNTPIQTVDTAFEDLKKSKADDRWLVILTDGQFDDGINNHELYKTLGENAVKDRILELVHKAQNEENLNVAYVGMGDLAVDLNSSGSEEGFYPYKTDTGHILDTITTVARNIFNLQKIDISKGNNITFDADIPMSKIIIFAQGPNIQIGDLKLNNGNVSAAPEVASVGIPENTPNKPRTKNTDSESKKVAPGLNGVVHTYDVSRNGNKPYADGNYSFSCNGTTTEVYFEPGLDIVTSYEGEDGEAIYMDTPGSLIPVGVKKVGIHLINPLTGKPVKQKESKLLQGVTLASYLVDSANNTIGPIKDGETVEIAEGSYEVLSYAHFKGDIETYSPWIPFSAGKASIGLSFTEPEYEVKLVSLKRDKEIELSITDEEGALLPDEDYANLQFTSIEGPAGVNWNYSYLGNGTYQFVPEFADPDLEFIAVSTKDEDLTVSILIQNGNIQKKGTAATKINWLVEDIALILDMQLPEATVPAEKFRFTLKNADDKKGKKAAAESTESAENAESAESAESEEAVESVPADEAKADSDTAMYMFDCEKRGAQSDAPYILLTASVDLGDGHTRPLTKDEWELCEINYNSKVLDQNFLWKFISSFSAQSLEFEVVKDTEVSKYRMYLDGLTASGVQPGYSRLNVTARVKYENGMKEEGEASDVVSVKPLNLWLYIGRLIMIILGTLLAVILLGLFIYMEITKPRFAKDMYPNTTVEVEDVGVPRKVDNTPCPSVKPVRYRIWPPNKPEERDIEFKYPKWMNTPVKFTVRAVGGGRFEIVNIAPFFRVKNNVRFMGVSFEEMKEKPHALNMNSEIVMLFEKATGKKIRLRMKFRRPQNARKTPKAKFAKKKPPKASFSSKSAPKANYSTKKKR